MGAFAVVVTGTSGAIQHVASGSVTVDFGLIPICYARVKGTVTDRETGLPIEGAQIPNFPQVSYRDLYTETTRRRVAELFEPDLREYGYEF